MWHAEEPHGHGVIEDTHMRLVEEPKVALVPGDYWNRLIIIVSYYKQIVVLIIILGCGYISTWWDL